MIRAPEGRETNPEDWGSSVTCKATCTGDSLCPLFREHRREGSPT